MAVCILAIAKMFIYHGLKAKCVIDSLPWACTVHAGSLIASINTKTAKMILLFILGEAKLVQLS